VKGYLCKGYVCVVLILGMTWTIAGCRPVERSATPSTTSPEVVAIPQPDRGDAEVSVPGEQVAVVPAAGALKMVPIEIELPAPAFRGTPVPLKEPNVEKPLGKPRPPFLAPEGTLNLARGKPVRGSDPAPPSGEMDYVTDGDKEASDFGYLGMRPGTQWVQIDLGGKGAVYAVLLWHNHAEARVYRDVIVQLGDDPDLLDAQTVFNNDYDNSSGLGIGRDKGYVETSEGKLIDCRGLQGRYIRLWSKGNHIDQGNHYTEVEVYGRPAA